GREGVGNAGSGPGRESTKPTLFPGADDPPNAHVVLDRCTGAREREPPPRAFGAARHGPRRRSTAARARGRADAPQRRSARWTDLSAGAGADEASLREQQVEHVPDATPERVPCLCQLGE